MADTKLLPLVRETRKRALLVARSVDSGLHTLQSELDILEMLRVTELVVAERLVAGVYTERQKDKKRQYRAFFASIKQQVLDSVRDVFINENGRASGLVLQKYNTLVLDALFNLLIQAGPENATRAAQLTIAAIRRDLLTLDVIDEFDAKVAAGVLAEMSKERARAVRRPLTKAQRLAAIDRAVQRHAELESEEDAA